MAPALDLDRFFPYQLSRLSNTVSQGSAHWVAQQFGLALREARLIVVLGAMQEASAVDLVQKTAMDKAPVSRALANLDQMGLVRRQPDPHDGRRALLSLTAKGQALHDALCPQLLERERALLAGLGDAERQQLLALLAQLAAHADALHEGPLPWMDE